MSVYRDFAARAGPYRLFPSLAVAVLLLSSTAHATDWYVSIEACPPDPLPYPVGIGTGAFEDPFCLIQDGIDAAQDGDRVLVLPGSYYLQFANMQGKAIQLISTGGPLVTRFEGRVDGFACDLGTQQPVSAARASQFAGPGGPFIVCDEGESSDTLIEGFEFYGGSADCGAGVLNDNGSSPTIKDCIFNGNIGGGICNLNGSSPRIIGCTFCGNRASSYRILPGCAITNTPGNRTSVRYCLFDQNAGAICDLGAFTHVTDSVFDFNGGWMFVEGVLLTAGSVNPWNGSHTVVERCRFDTEAIWFHNVGNVEIRDSTFGPAFRSTEVPSGCTLSAERTLFEGATLISSGGNIQITDSVFRDRSAEFSSFVGGSGTLSLKGCIFEGNVNLYHGQAVSWNEGDVFVERCLFDGNFTGDSGGAISFYGTANAQVLDCSFMNNLAIYRGGAIAAASSASVHISRCKFYGNEAFDGGALYISSRADATLIDSVFVGNRAQSSGAAVYTGAYTDDTAVLAIGNSSFVMNVTGEIGSVVQTKAFGPVDISNSVFWANENAQEAGEQPPFGGVATFDVAHSLVGGFGAWPGNGNFDADPMFLRNPDDGGDGWGVGDNDDYGDLHLAFGSPCINAGNPDFIPAEGKLDLDGHPRVLCSRVDVGPYEAGIGDLDCGGVVTICDMAYWFTCMGGAFAGYPPGCDAFDSDGDNDVDLLDASRVFPLFGCYDQVCAAGCP